MAETADRRAPSAVVSRVHIVGAGLAGLSAAVALAEAGRQVVLYEAGPAAGGRCRSYFDRELGLRIDNGNHLLLSGNIATMRYLRTIGARETLTGPGRAAFPFVDLATGERWTLALNAGGIPWWIFCRGRRVPGTRWTDYLRLLALRRAPPEATAAELLSGAGPLYPRLLESFAIAALNTPPDAALASLLGAVVRETLLRGGRACEPLVPRVGLSESLVDPAVSYLRARDGELVPGRRITALEVMAGRVRGLITMEGGIAVAEDEAVVLAVPPWVATDLLPGLLAPDAFQAIVNVHFATGLNRSAGHLIGVIGGTAEWIFVKDAVISVTISAANRLLDTPSADIAARCWADVRAACDLPPGTMPRVRVLTEKRATFAATAAQERRRPGARTALANLVLAGDWTATGLPATIEGAIRSGRLAADLLARR